MKRYVVAFPASAKQLLHALPAALRVHIEQDGAARAGAGANASELDFGQLGGRVAELRVAGFLAAVLFLLLARCWR